MANGRVFDTTTIRNRIDRGEADVDTRERALLIVAGAFVVVTRIGLLLAQGRMLWDVWLVVVWLACAVLGHRLLERSAPHRDPLLFPVAMLLSGWGINAIDRLLPPFAVRQTLWLVIGCALLVIVTWLPRDLRWLSRYRYLWLGGGLLALIGTIVLHDNPAELIKLSLLVFFASYLTDAGELLDAQAIRLGPVHIPSPRYLLPPIAMWGVAALILIWQHDFGVTMLYLILLILLLYAATGRLFYLVTGLGALLVAGAVALSVYSVARERLAIWFDPWSDAGGTSYQIVQSLMSFASGSIFGQGIGQGAPVYIPVVHSDLIFAAIGEEWGLLGSLAVVTCEAVLCIRALRLSIKQAHPFRALLTAGIGLTFGLQSALIMGGTLKLVPLTGITLPFVSYGGSSLVLSLVMIGLLITSGETAS